MGKAPEKVNRHGGVVKRYQRKASSLETAVTAVVAKQEDNQMEHREAEPVVVKASEKDATEARKPRNPASTRKKKPKAVVESVVVEAVEEVEVAVAVALKKKMKKRQLVEKSDVETCESTLQPQPQLNDGTEDVDREVVASAVGKQKLSKSQQRKHKQQSRTGDATASGENAKKEPPSLLKRLLWKAKPVAPALSPSSQSSASSSAAVEVVEPTMVSRTKSNSISQPKHPRRTHADVDEEEEVAYTVSERKSRKMQATKRVQKTKDKSKAFTVAAAPAPVCTKGSEPSSQETQSGSDEEDAASPSFLTAFENLVPTDAIQPKELSTALVLQTASYPEPFPVALAADAELLNDQGITVHEILIKDFAFHPPQLRIKTGDVVVWKVSSETLGMVEHSLEVGMAHRVVPKQKKIAVVKASTPPLGSGASFAWRFTKSSQVAVECAVYHTKGVVLVGNVKAAKDKTKTLAIEKTEAVVSEAVVETRTLSKAQIKRQKLAAKRLRAAEAARLAAEAARSDAGSVDSETGRDSLDTEPVFHPPQDLSRSAEVDAGVCRAVLTQLEEVAAAKQSTTSVIVIGDVECPVISNNQLDEHDDPPLEASSITVGHADGKPSISDEWSGTEEEDEDEEYSPERDGVHETDEMEDFQQRIIGMLQRSEQARADQRRSFQPEGSGFDAGAAYDFFKRRFMQIQKEERPIVYARCPEHDTTGLKTTDIVRALAGGSA